MSDFCSGLKLPPYCAEACPCDPTNTDRCERNGFCHCRQPYCGPRCLDTNCYSADADVWKIIVSVIAGVILIVILGAAIFLYRKKKQGEEERRSMEDAAQKHIMKGSHSNLRFAFDKDDANFLQEVKVEQNPAPPTSPPPQVPNEENATEIEDADDDDDEYVPDDHEPEPAPATNTRVYAPPPTSSGANTSASGSPYSKVQRTTLPPPEQLPLIRHGPPAPLTLTRGSTSSNSSSNRVLTTTITKTVNISNLQTHSIQHHNRPPTEIHQATPVTIASGEGEDDSSDSSTSSRGKAVRNNGAYNVRQQQAPRPSNTSYHSSH